MNNELFSQLLNSGYIATALLVIAISLAYIAFKTPGGTKSKSKQ